MHNGLVISLREYLSSIATFSDIYKKVRDSGFESFYRENLLPTLLPITIPPSCAQSIKQTNILQTEIYKHGHETRCHMPILSRRQELGVWSESLPQAQTCAIGQKADAMLRAYRHVAATLESLNTIRGLREALVASKQPLQVDPGDDAPKDGIRVIVLNSIA